MSEAHALCHGTALEEEARIEQAKEVLEFVPARVRAELDEALRHLIDDVRSLGDGSCLRQALEESDLRLTLDGWSFRLRVRARALQVVAATPK